MKAYKLDRANRSILELLHEKIKAILKSEIICEEDLDSIQHEATELDIEILKLLRSKLMTEFIISYVAVICFTSFFSVTGSLAKDFKNSNKGGLELIEKKKGSAARKQTDPKRMTEIKRLVESKKIKRKNQALLLKFDKDYPDLTFDEAGVILGFIHWLENNDYHIINGKEVFCFPFSKLVRKKDLK